MTIRHILDGFWDRRNVKGVNDNFQFLFDGVSYVLNSITNTLDELDKQKTDYEQKFTFLFDSVGEVKTLSNKAEESLDKANDLLTKNEDTNVRLDNLIAQSETSSTEVVDARGEFTVLNSRLLNQDRTANYLGVKTNEKSYMKFLQENSAQIDDNKVKVNDDRNIDVSIAISNIEYFNLNFAKNNNDDFLKFRNADLNASMITPKYESVDQSMISNATFYGSGNNWYIADVGGKVTFNFTGSSISMRYYTDIRGGIWKASVDGNEIKSFSTNADAQSPSQLVQAAVGEVNIIKGLSLGTHTLTLEFMGQDDNYPSSSPRGWLRSKTESETDTVNETFIYEDYDISKVNVLYDSNKEFAFDVDVNGNREWIPEHNSKGTLKIGENGVQKLIVDNKEISINSPSPEQSFKELKILQKLYGYNSAATDPVCEVLCIATITSRGVKFNTSFKWLQEVTVNGYVNMFTISPKFADTLTTSYGGKYDLDIYDNSYEYLNEEAPYSYIATGKTFPDFYATIDNLNSWETLRLGKNTRDGDKWGSKLFALQHRNDYLQKIYPKTYTNHTTEPNEVYKFEGFFGFGKLPMINDYI